MHYSVIGQSLVAAIRNSFDASFASVRSMFESSIGRPTHLGDDAREQWLLFRWWCADRLLETLAGIESSARQQIRDAFTSAFVKSLPAFGASIADLLPLKERCFVRWTSLHIKHYNEDQPGPYYWVAKDINGMLLSLERNTPVEPNPLITSSIANTWVSTSLLHAEFIRDLIRHTV